MRTKQCSMKGCVPAMVHLTFSTVRLESWRFAIFDSFSLQIHSFICERRWNTWGTLHLDLIAPKWIFMHADMYYRCRCVPKVLSLHWLSRISILEFVGVQKSMTWGAFLLLWSLRWRLCVFKSQIICNWSDICLTCPVNCKPLVLLACSWDWLQGLSSACLPTIILCCVHHATMRSRNVEQSQSFQGY